MSKEFDNTNKWALWKKTDKNDKPYLSWEVDVNGTLYWISVFTNGYKEKDSHPDFNVTIKEKEVKEAPAKEDKVADPF